MIRRITLAFVALFGLMLLSDLAHADGAATFAKCKACHGADGKGNAAMKVSPFDTTKADATLIATVTEGKPPKMPSYKGKLTEAEIAEVVAYIKTLK